jgi:uncharacterized protein YjbI with pentapeptide repeats
VKRFLSRLIVLLLCIAAGWVAGYLNIPYVEQYYSFWVGVLATVTYIGLFLGILWVWDKRLAGFLRPKFGGKAGSVTGISLVVLLLFALVYQVNKNKSLKADELILNKELNEARLVLDSVTSINAAVLLKELLTDIRKELDSSTSRKLSSRTIQKIVNVNQALKPYKRVVSDSMVLITSPERGQLFSFLALSEMDTSSFKIIKKQVSFAHTFLPNAQLKGIDLSGIDLSESYLAEADFTGSDLRKSDFRGSVLTYVIVKGVKAFSSSFHFADLRYSEVSESSFSKSDFRGSILKDLRCRNTTFRGSKIYLANLSYASFVNCDFSETVFTRTNLSNANFYRCDLKDIQLRKIIISETRFEEVQVDKDWNSKLLDWEFNYVDSVYSLDKVKRKIIKNDTIYVLN